MTDRPLISMVMIAKDEQPNIQACFESWWDHVDEVVLVDTGSTDDTLLVAKRFARKRGQARKLKTAQFDWCQDFAAARNHADSLATGQWLSWCDLDDTVHGMAALRDIATQAADEVDGFFCRYEYAKDAHGTVVSELWRERLVRNGRGHWTGAVHECKVVEGGARFQQIPMEVAWWEHRRPIGEAYGERNLTILKAWDEREPDVPRVVSYLGTELIGLERKQEAIEQFERYLRLPMESPDNYCQAARLLCALLCEAGQVERATQVAMQALQVNPAWTDTYLTLCEIAHAHGRFADGLVWAQHAQRLGKPATHLIVNPSQYDAHVPGLMAACLYGLGRLDEAIEQTQRALAAAPGYMDLDKRLPAWVAEAARHHTAGAFVNLASVLDQAGDADCALRVIECAPPMIAEMPALIAKRGELRRKGMTGSDADALDPASPASRFLERQLREAA